MIKIRHREYLRILNYDTPTYNSLVNAKMINDIRHIFLLFNDNEYFHHYLLEDGIWKERLIYECIVLSDMTEEDKCKDDDEDENTKGNYLNKTLDAIEKIPGVCGVIILGPSGYEYYRKKILNEKIEWEFDEDHKLILQEYIEFEHDHQDTENHIVYELRNKIIRLIRSESHNFTNAREIMRIIIDDFDSFLMNNEKLFRYC